jgi:tRNA pseudouridine55 synthase
MNGILIVDKPAGITSHDVVSKLRRILRTKKVGHTGTLDPFATGVMTVLIGSATRLAQYLDKDEKEYQATVRFGFATDTGDRTGQPIGDVIGADTASEIVRKADWENVLARFRGFIEQVPPMYSAKKIDGKKLYELAREGVTVERAPVTVNISLLELVREPVDEIAEIRVACSAGTYVRTLAEDIGKELCVGAHLTELRRTRSGRFTLADAKTLEEVAAMDQPENALLRIETAVDHLPELVLAEDRVERTRNGMSTRVFDALFADGETLRMRTEGGELIAIGFYKSAENAVQPKVVLS